MRNIREARKRCEMTLAEVAEQAGMSTSYLSDLECGRANNPSLKVLRNLAKCYNVTVESLQDDEVELAPQPIDSQRWHQLHDRYWATTPVYSEPGKEQFAIDRAIYWGVCECTGRALHPCRVVQVTTTVLPCLPDQYGHPMSSIYVTVIAEPMIPSQQEQYKIREFRNE